MRESHLGSKELGKAAVWSYPERRKQTRVNKIHMCAKGIQLAEISKVQLISSKILVTIQERITRAEKE